MPDIKPQDASADQIDDLKQEVLNKKTQMLIFRQLIRNEGIESNLPTLTITHSNRMSSRFQIYSLTYTLDDERVYTYYVDEPSDHKSEKDKELPKDIQVFKRPIGPGSHTILVDVVYRGHDAGVFSYINDYKVPSQLSKTFKIEKNQSLDVQVVGYEKGWALTDFKDRPDLKINFHTANLAKDLK